MRLLLHEWCCSGGLGGPGRAAASPAEGLFREGRAMLAALLRDGARSAGLEIAVLLDERLLRETGLAPEIPAGVTTIPVAPGAEIDALVAAAKHADRTLLVAPESDGLLAERVAAVRATGGDVIAPDARFLAAAADKQVTAGLLAARGLPLPAGTTLAPGDAVPAGFPLPAVAKARGGCGGEGFVVIHAREDLPAAAFERRLEAFVPGTPVGVACLCGPAGVECLPAARQRCSRQGAYLGGDFALSASEAPRAEALAARAIQALAAATGPARGWVGVDMILGESDDGRLDRVLEINPRLTSSFVGHARRSPSSLLGAVVAVADGAMPTPGTRDWLPGTPFDAA